MKGMAPARTIMSPSPSLATAISKHQCLDPNWHANRAIENSPSAGSYRHSSVTVTLQGECSRVPISCLGPVGVQCDTPIPPLSGFPRHPLHVHRTGEHVCCGRLLVDGGDGDCREAPAEMDPPAGMCAAGGRAQGTQGPGRGRMVQ